MNKPRYLERCILEDLEKKMVFIAGPRQVGKTTLAVELMNREPTGRYYLWDNREDRREMLNTRWPAGPAVVVLDELHKYRKWKQWLKGEYDRHKTELKFIVTGSGRMDIYRRGGDSLQGRYHNYRLHPFSLQEMAGRISENSPMKELDFIEGDEKALSDLVRYGGFPEPLLSQSERAWRRWKKERTERFFREDVRDLEHLRDLSSIQLLADLLPGKVGSTISLNSIREDLDVSHRAVSHWMDVLERLYYIFRIRTFTGSRIRGLKKEAKAYMWDWSEVDDPGARFENMIASHLFKFCHFMEDTEGYRTELHYLRDVDKREVDFLVSVDGKPWFAVETKLGEEAVSQALRYFGDRLNIPFLFQVGLNSRRDVVEKGVRSLSASKFLTALV